MKSWDHNLKATAAMNSQAGSHSKVHRQVEHMMILTRTPGIHNDYDLDWRPTLGHLEEVGLLHDAEELFLVHLPITITISLIDHFLQLLVSHALTELLRDTLQVLERDLACLIIIEETEGFQDFVFGVTIQDLVCHHLEKFLVLDGATSIVIDIGDHLLDLLLLRLEAKRTHGNLELFGINGAGAIGIEEVECLLDLLLLIPLLPM